MSIDTVTAGAEMSQQRFERILSQGQFEGLRAVLDRVSPDRAMQYAAVNVALGYEDLLGRLGYKVTVIKQIHVQDAYARMGQESGIKAVLPYHDIPTQSSLPTLVHYDASVTTTPKSAAFFNSLLLALKKQLGAVQ